MLNRQVKSEVADEVITDTSSLSDADLKAKLSEDRPGETIVEETDELKADDDLDGGKDPEPKDDNPDAEKKGDPEGQHDEYSKLSKEELAEKVRKLTKQVNDKESFIQKRRSEIAELKKQVAARKASLDKERENSDPDFKDKFFDDPEKGVDEILKRKGNEAERQKILNDEYRLEAEEFVLRIDPDFNNKLDDMVEIIVKDLKVPKERALQFRSDPFNENREILVDLIRRVETKKLNEKIAALEKKPKEMLDKIELLTKRKGFKPSPDKRSIDLEKIQIANLKDDELANYLKERKDT